MPAKAVYHRMKSLNARVAANYKRGFGPSRAVLLLTTTGRISGMPRITPLQFEKVDGDILPCVEILGLTGSYGLY